MTSASHRIAPGRDRMSDATYSSQAGERTLQRIAGTFATKVLAVSLSVPVSIILARALGPDGRGDFVAAAALVAIGMQLGNLGLHSANTYFVSRDRSLLGPLSINSAIIGTLLGGVIAAVLYLVRASGLFFGDLDTKYFLLALVWIPLGIGQLLQQNLVVGIQRFAVFNNVDLGMRTGNLLLCLALWLLGVATPVPYTVVAIVVLAVSYAFCFWYIRGQVDGLAGPSLGLLRKQLPYGTKMFLASLFAFLVVRLDVILLKELSGSHETGVYSVAVSLVDMLYLVPVAVGVVLFPELSAPGDPGKRWRVTQAALLHTGWIIGVGAAVLMIWGESLIRLLFGAAFLPAYAVVIVLAPAMLFYGLNNIVSIYLASTGLPWFAVWVWVLGLCVNVALNLRWIPRYGGVGAAWASLAAYGVVLVLQLSYAAGLTVRKNVDVLAGAQS
jgi:O-antigen/teichoic acid export membrane protein